MGKSWLDMSPHDFYGPERPARKHVTASDIKALHAHVRRLRREAERVAA